MKFIFEKAFKAQASAARKHIMDLCKNGLLKRAPVIRPQPRFKPRIFRNSMVAKIQRRPNQPVMEHAKERLARRPELLLEASTGSLVNGPDESPLRSAIRKVTEYKNSSRFAATYSIRKSPENNAFNASPQSIVDLVSPANSTFSCDLDSCSGASVDTINCDLRANPRADLANDPNEIDDAPEGSQATVCLSESSLDSDAFDATIFNADSTDSFGEFESEDEEEKFELSRSKIGAKMGEKLREAFIILFPNRARKWMSSKQAQSGSYIAGSSKTLFLETPNNRIFMKKEIRRTNSQSIITTRFSFLESVEPARRREKSSGTTTERSNKSGFDKFLEEDYLQALLF